MQQFFVYDSHSDTIRLMPGNLQILYRNHRRWMMDIDLLVDRELACRICNTMHDYETAYQPVGGVLAARLDTCLTPATDEQPQSRTAFTFIPATTWTNWPERMITFYGAKGHYIIHDNTAYFIWDGTHVATLTYYNFLWHPSINVPELYKELTCELVPALKQQFLFANSLQQC